MSGNWFVTPDTERLNIGDSGEWVDIKRELGLAEQKRLESSPMTGVKNMDGLQNGSVRAEDAEVGLSWGKFYLTKLELYLVGWSLRDAKGAPVPLSVAAIHSLRPEAADLIMAALNAYLDAQDAERKANPTGRTKSEPLSA